VVAMLVVVLSLPSDSRLLLLRLERFRPLLWLLRRACIILEGRSSPALAAVAVAGVAAAVDVSLPLPPLPQPKGKADETKLS